MALDHTRDTSMSFSWFATVWNVLENVQFLFESISVLRRSTVRRFHSSIRPITLLVSELVSSQTVSYVSNKLTLSTIDFKKMSAISILCLKS